MKNMQRMKLLDATTGKGDRVIPIEVEGSNMTVGSKNTSPNRSKSNTSEEVELRTDVHKDKETGIITVTKRETNQSLSPEKSANGQDVDVIHDALQGSLRSAGKSTQKKRKQKSKSPHRQRAEEEIAHFDPSAYKFKKPDYNYKQEQYKQRFIDHLGAHKNEINKQLVELCYMQVLNRFKKEGEDVFPARFKENQVKWAGLLMRSKKLQAIFGSFTDQIAWALEDELTENMEIVSAYVKYPHAQHAAARAKSISPRRKQTTTGTDFFSSLGTSRTDSPLEYYPERAPKNKFQLSIFNRAKEHLQMLKEKNEVKKKEKIEEKVKEQYDERKKQRITDQVLERMKIRPGAKLDADGLDKNQILFTPLQEDMHERLERALEKIDSLNFNNVEIKEELDDAEKDLETLEDKKKTKNPGVAVKHMLSKMAAEHVYTQEEMDAYANELWLTAERFQEQLEKEENAMRMELRLRTAQFNTRVDGIRAQASFKIEALESALIETKIKYQREMERAEMKLAEMESQMLNKIKTDEEIDQGLNDAMAELEEYPDFSKRRTVAEQINREDKFRALITKLQISVRSLQSEKVEQAKEIKELKDRIQQDAGFYAKVQGDFKKTKEINLFYQVIIYDFLKRTQMFDEDSKATDEDKLMFKEIAELNDERMRLDKYEEQHLTRRDAKKSLKRLSEFVDEVHDILVTLDVKQIMKNYWNIIEEKNQKTRDLVVNMANIQLIPPQLLPKEAQTAFVEQQTQTSPKSPAKKLNKKSLLKEQFNRVPMIHVKDETRDNIEENVKIIVNSVADTVNTRITEQREKEAEARRQNIQTPVISEVTPSEAQEDDFEKLGKLQDLQGGIDEEDKEEFMAKLEIKQAKRAEETEKRERIASARRKKNEELRLKKEEMERQKELRRERKEAAKGSGAQKSRPAKKRKHKSPPGGATPVVKISRKSTPADSLGDLDSDYGNDKEEGEQPLPSKDKFGFESGNQITENIEPPDLAKDFYEDLQGKITEKYTEQLMKTDLSDPMRFKLNETQFEGLWQAFKNSLGHEPATGDYLSLFEKSFFADFIEEVNEIQKKYMRSPKDQQDTNSTPNLKSDPIPMGDCIATDIDSEGNFNGFTIRAEMCKMIYWRDGGKMDYVLRIIKTVNYLNRLVLESGKDYILGSKKIETAKIDAAVQVDTYEPAAVEAELKEPAKAPPADALWTPVLKDFMALLKKHVIDIIARDNPSRRSYYYLVFDDQTLDEIVNYKLSSVYEDVPGTGFENEADRPDDINVCEYFRLLFKSLEEKLEQAVPREEKKVLSIKKLVWRGLDLQDANEVYIPLPSVIAASEHTQSQYSRGEPKGSQYSKGEPQGSQYSKESVKVQSKPERKNSRFDSSKRNRNDSKDNTELSPQQIKERKRGESGQSPRQPNNQLLRLWGGAQKEAHEQVAQESEFESEEVTSLRSSLVRKQMTWRTHRTNKTSKSTLLNEKAKISQQQYTDEGSGYEKKVQIIYQDVTSPQLQEIKKNYAMTSKGIQTPAQWLSEMRQPGHRSQRGSNSPRAAASPFAKSNLAASVAVVKKAVETQTTEEMLQDLVSGNGSYQVNKAMGEEISKTVGVLEDYIKVMASKQKHDAKVELQAQKAKDGKADAILFANMVNAPLPDLPTQTAVISTSQTPRVRSRLRNLREELAEKIERDTEALNREKFQAQVKTQKNQVNIEVRPPVINSLEKKSRLKQHRNTMTPMGGKLPSLNVEEMSSNLDLTQEGNQKRVCSKKGQYKEIKQQSMDLNGNLLQEHGSLNFSTTARVTSNQQNPFKQVNKKQLSKNSSPVAGLAFSPRVKKSTFAARMDRGGSLKPGGEPWNNGNISNRRTLMVNEPSGDFNSSFLNHNDSRENQRSFFMNEPSSTKVSTQDFGSNFRKQNFNQSSFHNHAPNINPLSQLSNEFIKQTLEASRQGHGATAFLRIQNPKALQVLQKKIEPTRKESGQMKERYLNVNLNSNQTQRENLVQSQARLTPEIPVDGIDSPGRLERLRKASTTMVISKHHVKGSKPKQGMNSDFLEMLRSDEAQ